MRWEDSRYLATHHFDNVRLALQACGNNRIALFIKVHLQHLPIWKTTAAELSIEHDAGIIEEAGYELRNSRNVFRPHDTVVQMVSQDLLDQPRIRFCLANVEDSSLGDDGCDGGLDHRLTGGNATR
jgi:hypothetical protein